MPTLARLAEDAEIRFVDVGGRGSAVPQLRHFASVAHYYACEPDLQEAARLTTTLTDESPWRSVTVITEAIAARDGKAQLHLTASPGMSSLLPPDLEVAERFCLGHRFQVMSTTTVPTLTLDEAARRYRFRDACFLKLDTQGTELEILQSGPATVRSVVGIYVETNFQPFYKGQALFADVDAHLRGQGFSLFGLDRTLLRRNGYHPETYSRRLATWAHCLYLREPHTLEARGQNEFRRSVLRLLVLAIAFKHFDFASELLQQGSRCFVPNEEVWRTVCEEAAQFIEWATRRLMRKTKRRAVSPSSESPESALLKPYLRDSRDDD